MPNQPLPIIGGFDKQRFKQFNPEDAANWYLTKSVNGKRKVAMYPSMGRRHINFLNKNRLVFASEPRAIFRSIKYYYVVVDNTIFRIDKLFNRVEITSGLLQTLSGEIYFDYLVTPDIVFCGFTDGRKMYVYREDTGDFTVVNDANAPSNPKYIAVFGNRFAVSQNESSQFNLTKINLDDVSYDPATCFTVNGEAVFAQESGIIRQFGVLHNTLYIFTDFTTGIWSNTQSVFVSPAGVQSFFPWKKNTSYDWDYGIADPQSLSVTFGRMVWIGQSQGGLIQVFYSAGQSPVPISTKAIDILFQRDVLNDTLSPFVEFSADGFLYQYENTIFYRLSAGAFQNYGTLDVLDKASAIEYNFDTQMWNRCIEKNGERNRIKKHIYFNNTHLVTVQDDSTVYEMSGQFYDNEITNPDRLTDQQPDAYLREPFRYERVTPIICEDDDAEFSTDWVQIDFVFGDSTFLNFDGPFPNAIYLIDEDAMDGEPVYLLDENGDYLIQEGSDYPVESSTTYKNWFKPHVELYFSNDGGVSFYPANVKEFSPLGKYQWRMRWYELGTSRNRVYKLICVSPSPMVVLGGLMNTRRVSGGAS